MSIWIISKSSENLRKFSKDHLWIRPRFISCRASKFRCACARLSFATHQERAADQSVWQRPSQSQSTTSQLKSRFREEDNDDKNSHFRRKKNCEYADEKNRTKIIIFVEAKFRFGEEGDKNLTFIFNENLHFFASKIEVYAKMIKKSHF